MNVLKGILVFFAGLFVVGTVYLIFPTVDSVMTATAIIFLAAVIAASSSNRESKK